MWEMDAGCGWMPWDGRTVGAHRLSGKVVLRRDLLSPQHGSLAVPLAMERRGEEGGKEGENPPGP